MESGTVVPRGSEVAVEEDSEPGTVSEQALNIKNITMRGKTVGLRTDVIGNSILERREFAAIVFIDAKIGGRN